MTPSTIDARPGRPPGLAVAPITTPGPTRGATAGPGVGPLRRLAGGLVAAVLVGLAAATLGTHPVVLRDDSAQYLREAEHLRRGDGFVTTILCWDENYRTGVPALQTVHPPGYPLLIALALATTGLDGPTAALVVGIVSATATLGLLVALARTIGLSPAATWGVAVIWLGCTANWFLVLDCLSETSLTACTLASALALLCGWRAPTARASMGAALLAGSLAAGAFAIRYAGVFWIGVLAAAYLARFAARRDGASLRDGLLAAAPIVVTGLVLALRNRAVGDLVGHSVAGGLPLPTVLRELGYSVSEILGLDGQGLRRGRLGEVLAVGWVILSSAVLVVVVPRLGAGGWPNRGDDRLGLGLAVALGYVGLSVLGLGYLAWTSPIDLGGRMLLPLLPLGLLAGASVAGTALAAARPPLPLAWIGLGLLVLVVGQVQAYADHERRYEVHRARATRLREGMADPAVRAVLAASADGHRPLLTNDGPNLGLLLDQPVVALPPDAYSPEDWTEARVGQLVERLGIRQLVCIPARLTADHRRDRLFREIRDGRLPAGWVDVLRSPALIVCARLPD